jgi:hypothetical protein
MPNQAATQPSPLPPKKKKKPLTKRQKQRRWQKIREETGVWSIVLAVIGLGIGLMSVSPPEFDWAKACFTLAAIAITIRVWFFVKGLSLRRIWRISLIIGLNLTVFFLWSESQGWVEGRRVQFAQRNADLAGVYAEKIRNQQISTYKLDVAPCRSESLTDCGDDQLFAWGTSLVDKMQEAGKRFVSSVDYAKSQTDANLRVSLLKLALQTMAIQFRDCCAQDDLKYMSEVPLRMGGGYRHDNTIDFLKDVSESPSFLKKTFGSTELTEVDGMRAILAYIETVGLHVALGQKIDKMKARESKSTK